MQSPHPKLSEQQIAQAWAQITVKLWRMNLNLMKIGQNSSGELFRSIKFNVNAGGGGNVDRALNAELKNIKDQHHQVGIRGK